MAAKKRKKKPAPRKKTARKRVAKHARKKTVKRARKKTAKRTRKKTARRTTRRAPKRKVKRKKKPARRKTSAKRKAGRKVRRKTAKRKIRRKPIRKTARKRPKSAARKKKKPARRKASARSRSARKRGKARPTARKRTAKRRPAARKIRRQPARRKSAARKRKKPVRRFPKAPTAAARKPAPGLTLRKLAARLTPQIKPPIEAYSGNKPYIFASYSHKNIKEVFWCIKKLAESRYRIWYDEGIEPGNEWPEEVGRALTGCRLFLVFMSPAAMDSRNVRNEINFASSENKSMMVVFLQPAELSEGMQLQIGTVQFIHKNEMTEAEFLDKMKKVLDPELRI
ncbi:MAG: TIR domain-containing protein [Spirochaetia bacterium]|jgi:hypothetical protein